jgi:hypothetical protein
VAQGFRSSTGCSTANTRKNLGQIVALLHLLDCEVEFVINPRRAA